MVLSNATANMAACNVYSNTANGGAGLFVISGTANLVACDVYSNVANEGGGLGVISGTLVLDGTSIRINTASQIGGGLANFAGTGFLRNATFSGNTATIRGSNLHLPGGVLYYQFPLPPGHWLPNRECRVYRAGCANPADYACQASFEACSVVVDPSGSTTASVPSSSCVGNYLPTCQDSACCPTNPQPCTSVGFIQPCDWQASPTLLGTRVYTLPAGIPVDDCKRATSVNPPHRRTSARSAAIALRA